MLRDDVIYRIVYSAIAMEYAYFDGASTVTKYHSAKRARLATGADLPIVVVTAGEWETLVAQTFG